MPTLERWTIHQLYADKEQYTDDGLFELYFVCICFCSKHLSWKLVFYI